jgi:hypothetical protein
MQYRNRAGRNRHLRAVCIASFVLALAGGVAVRAAEVRLLVQRSPLAEVRLLVQRSPLAGYRYYQAPVLFELLQPGEALTLVREPHNPHDANAVRVDWRGHTLGYVPRRQNAALAWALDEGQPVEARIAQRRRHPNPRRRVELEVFLR